MSEAEQKQKQKQKQMGCMAGFLHMLDRHHLLLGKRIYSTKTLPPNPDPMKTQGSREAPSPGLSTSPSIVARLMGLEDSNPEVRKCASDVPEHRFYSLQLTHKIGDARGMGFYDSADLCASASACASARASAKQILLLHSTSTAPSPTNRSAIVLMKPLGSSSPGNAPPQPSFHTERFRREEGKTLLERCDKLLSSIAEITSESPVSVLHSSFCKEEDSCFPSPSPVMKRCVDYTDVAADMWSGALCCGEDSQAQDLVYVSEILRASNHFPEDTDFFLLLEKQQRLKGNDTSKPSTLRRRLIFDTVHEILNWNRRLPPWKAVNNTPLLDRIWSEFRRIREREELRKEDSWGEYPVDMGLVVLDMERLVFKDLITETIRDLAFFKPPKCNSLSPPRRKLVF